MYHSGVTACVERLWLTEGGQRASNSGATDSNPIQIGAIQGLVIFEAEFFFLDTKYQMAAACGGRLLDMGEGRPLRTVEYSICHCHEVILNY